MKAVDVYISLGLLRDALRHLYDCNFTETAAMFVQACQEHGVGNRVVNDPRADASPLEGQQLIAAVGARYAEYLEKVGFAVPTASTSA